MMLNKLQSITAVLIAGFLYLELSGCTKTTHTVDSSLAEQIALDSAGINKDEVTGLETNSSENGFKVTFYNDSGKYIIGIDNEGKVNSYEFTKQENPSQNQEKVQERVQEKVQDKDSAESNQPESDSHVSTGVQLPEGSLSRSELIRRMAVFLGINQYDEADFTIESITSDQAVMTVKLIDGRVLFTVINPYSGDILSSGSR